MPKSTRPRFREGAVYRISDLDLASRLSFFLWSRLPDEALLDKAAAGRLHDPRSLEAEVRRMLTDPRAESLSTNFAAQWLGVRRLDEMNPDPVLFPDFDEGLRAAFRREMQLFVGSIMHDDRSVLDLLDADYTFVNERLAPTTASRTCWANGSAASRSPIRIAGACWARAAC